MISGRSSTDLDNSLTSPYDRNQKVKGGRSSLDSLKPQGKHHGSDDSSGDTLSEVKRIVLLEQTKNMTLVMEVMKIYILFSWRYVNNKKVGKRL